MALIINIETSTTVCSVTLADNGKTISKRESNDEKSHAKLLTLFIDEVLKESALNYNQIDAIAVSKGPGSYTGLRIGVSAAKGLCYALDKPLIAINTLQLMSFGLINKLKSGEILIDDPDKSLLMPMIDARRMEVYTAIYKTTGKIVSNVTAKVIDENSYAEILRSNTLICFGDGAKKVEQIINHPNLVYIPDIYPSAEDMVLLSNKNYDKREFEDAAYFEPFYLKDFIATIPKKNIFG